MSCKVNYAADYGRKENAIINGITDYEEEFAFVRAFDWSKDSKKLAYIRFDESQVPEFYVNV
jgi:dipeptidyl-peptidase-4